MAKIQTLFTASLIADAFGSITGQKPKINTYNKYVELDWTPAQRIAIQTWLDKQISSVSKGAPSDIRIKYNPVLLPYATKKLIAPVALAAILIFAIGVSYGRRR